MSKPLGAGLLSSWGFATVTAAAVLTPAGAATEPSAVRVSSDGDVDGDADLDHDLSAGRDLAIVLHELSPWLAIELATTWACSSNPERRRAVADALAWAFRLVGDDIVIDHLSRDPDPRIRLAAVRATWARREAGGDDGVLDRLADDRDPEVRGLALLAGSR